MTYKFSPESAAKLLTCDMKLQILFNEVISHWDCTIMVGHRNEEDQNEAFRNGFSKQKWPTSKHNKSPSLAVDVAPFPIDFKDTNRFYYFSGFVMGIAKSLGISIRWGGDWDSDHLVKDEKFLDLVHFELI